jgi:hypothetical protein
MEDRQLETVGDAEREASEATAIAGEPTVTEAAIEGTGTAEAVDHDPEVTPGDMLRALPAEAEKRGTRLVSAQAMQARLFSVYDAAAAAEDALALVQHQLTVTLDRGYYEADEIEHLAAELDSLLTLETLDIELADDGLVAEE